MAIPIEGFSVVAQLPRVQHLLDEGKLNAPNSRGIQDKHIWCCSFMAETDALRFMKELEELGLNVSQGPDSDVVLMNE